MAYNLLQPRSRSYAVARSASLHDPHRRQPRRAASSEPEGDEESDPGLSEGAVSSLDPDGSQPISITEPPALRELEAHGFGFGHHFASPTTRGDALQATPGWSSITHGIAVNLETLQREDSSLKVGMAYAHRLFDSDACEKDKMTLSSAFQGRRHPGPAPPSKFNECMAGRAKTFEECMSPPRLSYRKLCNVQFPCRDDYVCAYVPGAPKGNGACMPPYFIFQARVDGHE